MKMVKQGKPMRWKWYHWLIFIFAGLLVGFIVAFVTWWKTPLGPPLDIEKTLQLALPTDYTHYWGLVAGAFTFMWLVIAVEQGIIIHLMRKGLGNGH